MTLKALIVDDETASRETLQAYLLKYCTGVQVVALADSVKTALVEIEKHQPDVVFLDVEMPYGNAFDLLEQVQNIRFETVFVTAFSNYALQAINVSAAYYILKPIDIDELVAAVEKIKQAKEQKNLSLHTQILIDNIHTSNKQLHKLVLPVLDGFEVVQIKEIIHCQAQDNFTDFFFTNGKRMLICRTLKFYEQTLESFGFLRIHKSHLINLQYVKKYKKGKGGQVIMTDDAELELSVNKKDEFLERFKEGN
jgi:two-component system, LytTR family, response regulator